MRIKILVIAFCAFLCSFLIYEVYCDDRLNVLSLGDELSIGATPFNSYGDGYNDFLKDFLNKNDIVNDYNDYFISDGETYVSMVHKFDEDYFKKNLVKVRNNSKLVLDEVESLKKSPPFKF